MNEIFNCRFLTTVQTMSDEDITPSELQQQLSEFISQAKALLCGHEYLEVSDTYDSLVMAFDKVLGREKCLIAESVKDARHKVVLYQNHNEKRLSYPDLFLSAQGFLDYFLEIRMLFPTYEDAYEMLESQVERITGERMYSEYSSFRIQYLRWKTKKRSPK